LQYQNVGGGGAPKQQAWAFGGNATQVMPTAGTATYKGRYVGTAEAKGFLPYKGAKSVPDGLYRVEGSSTVAADFGTADSVSGNIIIETWTKKVDGADYIVRTSASGNQSVATTDNPYYDYIYETGIKFDTKLDPNGASTFSGKATLDEPYISGTNNTVSGGFFGTKAGEVAGVVNATGTIVDPLGGSNGVNDSKKATLSINGAFNGKCTNPGGVCPP
jgi:C-lobe and N-lobe beta barrels of Tf-binding protein B